MALVLASRLPLWISYEGQMIPLSPKQAKNELFQSTMLRPDNWKKAAQPFLIPSALESANISLQFWFCQYSGNSQKPDPWKIFSTSGTSSLLQLAGLQKEVLPKLLWLLNSLWKLSMLPTLLILFLSNIVFFSFIVGGTSWNSTDFTSSFSYSSSFYFCFSDVIAVLVICFYFSYIYYSFFSSFLIALVPTTFFYFYFSLFLYLMSFRPILDVFYIAYCFILALASLGLYYNFYQQLISSYQIQSSSLSANGNLSVEGPFFLPFLFLQFLLNYIINSMTLSRIDSSYMSSSSPRETQISNYFIFFERESALFLAFSFCYGSPSATISIFVRTSGLNYLMEFFFLRYSWMKLFTFRMPRRRVEQK